MKTFIKSLLFVIIGCPFMVSLITSCAEESDCSTAGRPTLRGNFYVRNEDGTMNTAPAAFVTVRAFYTDSLILNALENADSVSIPLRYAVDSTVLVFQFNREDPDQADTVIIWHKNTLFFISVDCGYEVKQILEDRKNTKHYLDTIIVRDKNTNTDGTESLQIVLKPTPTDDDNSIVGTK